MSDNEKCSFCNKGKQDVSKLLKSPAKFGVQVCICDECIEECTSILSSQTKQAVNADKASYTPEELKAKLDEHVVGQDVAKEILSLAVYNHYKRINNPNVDVEIQKSNIMLMGPSGCGKTLLVSTIAKLLNLPMITVDSTSITEAGYVGDNVDSIFEKLLKAAGGDIERAQKGIVFIDEIDKKRSRSTHSEGSGGQDVSGEGVQQSLLRVIEGSVVRLEQPMAFPGMRDTLAFDTTNVLFIVGGAFVGIDKIINKRLASGGSKIGFGASVDKTTSGNVFSVEPEDLYAYGFIREFVGRFPVVVPFHEVTEDMLVRILKEPKSCILNQFKTLFELDGVELEFSDKFVQSVAEKAIKRQAGARGLRTILEKELTPVAYRLPSLYKDGYRKVTITAPGEHELSKGQNEAI